MSPSNSFNLLVKLTTNFRSSASGISSSSPGVSAKTVGIKFGTVQCAATPKAFKARTEIPNLINFFLLMIISFKIILTIPQEEE